MRWCVLLFPALLSAQLVELGPPPRAPEVPIKAPDVREATRERGVGYDTADRETVRQAYLSTFVSASMGWTGAVAGCNEGTTSLAWRNSAVARINWFRAMAGVPSDVTFNDTYTAKSQRAALMMSANRSLSHTPDVNWPCANAAGIEAAGNSNLCYTWNTTPEPGCTSLYIEDSGTNNGAVGHRRWILYPQTQQMGTGDVDQTGSYPSGYPYANSLWVFDGNFGGTRPATRDGFVAWPPKGYVPYQKVYQRWSFSYPGANFSGATITMNGSGSGVTYEAVQNGYGENTLVWKWANQPTGVPASDTTITVVVSGITGAPQSSYTYQVTVFDPATSGSGGGTTAVTVTTNPAGRSFTVDGVSYSSGQIFNWTPGSNHTIATTSPQSAGSTRYVFSNWSDAGAISHGITTPASSTTYTANFTTQHLLTTSVSPGGTGTIMANPSSGDGYYNSGTSVQLTASGALFANWSGDLSGAANPQSVVMSGPRTVTANFSSSPACVVPQTAYNVPASAFAGIISVTGNCTFAATPQASWIRILSLANETPVRYSTDRNTGGSRVGAITIGATSITILQDAAPGVSSPLRFVSLEPCRLMETRPEYNFQGRTGAFGPPFLQAGETRTLTPSQSTVCIIPADAKAYVLNVTLVPRGAVDHITIWPAGQSRPNFWTVRSPDTQIVANAALVAAGTSGGIHVYASDHADLIIDIAGYFTDSAAASNLVFYPLTPCRVIDTRIDYRQPAGPFGPPSLTAQTKRTFQFPAGTYCAVPANARAFSVSLTAVPKGPLQFMTIWPAGGAQPNVSSINSPSGRILANSVIVPASGNGSIDVYAFNNTDFLIDINGYFAPDDGVNGLFFYTAAQCRISDTTTTDGPAYPNESTRTIGVAASDRCVGIPTTARAFALNFTAIPGGSPMPFLTAFPTGQSQPNASVLNAFEGQTVTNSAIIPSGPGGQVNVYAYRPTNVVVELSGYFSR